MNYKKLIFVYNVTLIISFASVCHANGGPDATIHSLVQEGQDVEILMGLIHDPSFPFTITRTRTDYDEEPTVVFEDLSLSEEDADDIVPYCDSQVPPEQVCLDNPDECIDCDGDGIIDCYADMCYQRWYFVLVDKCVMPDNWEYTAIVPSNSPNSETIEVVDSGDSCLDSNGSDDGSNGGCNVCWVGGTHDSLTALISLIFVFGLFFPFPLRNRTLDRGTQ
jgi:hypothetical protein